jgi:hypothetical protein
MKIKINTGVTVKPEDCVVDQLHPKHQIDTIRLWVNMKNDFELTTNSDFIIRELNCFIMDGTLSLEEVEVFEDSFKLEGDLAGFSIKSLDDVIEEQNTRSNELYYSLKYRNYE